MLSFLMLLALAQERPEPARVHDGGVCVGLAWVALVPGETAFVEHGPDFDVWRFERLDGAADRTWSVYHGNHAAAEGNGPELLARDGVHLRRASEGGAFRGYLAERRGEQNHFFGAAFHGDTSDRAFFDRIDFGANGRVLCANLPPVWD